MDLSPELPLPAKPLPPADFSDVESLLTPVEWMRFCPNCDREQSFFADRVCAAGLVGCCMKCGDERVARFTRTSSEVA